MKTLFIIHLFEGKKLAESAGYNEIMMPMIASKKINDYKLISFGHSLARYEQRVDEQVELILSEVGQTPVLIYGAGAHSQKFYPKLSKLNIFAFVDRSKELINTKLFGHPIISNKELANYNIPVVVSSRAWEDSIIMDLMLNYPNLPSVYALYDIKKFEKKDREKMLVDIESSIAQFNPELVVYTPTHPHESLNNDEVNCLKKQFCFKMLTVWWDYDENSSSNSYIDFEVESLKYSDAILDAGNYSKTRKVKLKQKPFENYIGTEKILVGPSLCNPDVFYPRNVLEKKYDIAIFGSLVGRRRKWVDFLAEKYGKRFWHFGGNYREHSPLDFSEYARLISETKIFVNTQTYSFRSQCKGKVREALMSGVFLLEEDNPDTREFIPDEMGVEYFKNAEELVDKIDFYLTNEKERKINEYKSHQWFVENYNCELWVNKILGKINGCS